MRYRSGWEIVSGSPIPVRARLRAPRSDAVTAQPRDPTRDAGLRQKKTRRRLLVSCGLVLCSLFDELETIAFFGNHSESASVVPLDVDCSEVINGCDYAFVAVLQFRVWV